MKTISILCLLSIGLGCIVSALHIDPMEKITGIPQAGIFCSFFVSLFAISGLVLGTRLRKKPTTL